MRSTLAAGRRGGGGGGNSAGLRQATAVEEVERGRGGSSQGFRYAVPSPSPLTYIGVGAAKGGGLGLQVFPSRRLGLEDLPTKSSPYFLGIRSYPLIPSAWAKGG